jgi:hypothetical protein
MPACCGQVAYTGHGYRSRGAGPAIALARDILEISCLLQRSRAAHGLFLNEHDIRLIACTCLCTIVASMVKATSMAQAAAFEKLPALETCSNSGVRRVTTHRLGGGMEELKGEEQRVCSSQLKC